MIDGLVGIEKDLSKLGIPFFFLTGMPYETIPTFVKENKVSLIVTDFSPMRISKIWHDKILESIKNEKCGFHIVDAHNVVPCWIASPKIEYAARTIRIKINKILHEYLTEFPEV